MEYIQKPYNLNSAGNILKVKLRFYTANPTISTVSTSGKITVFSTYQGKQISETYTEQLDDTALSIKADADTFIYITGNVNYFYFGAVVDYLDISNNFYYDEIFTSEEIFKLVALNNPNLSSINGAIQQIAIRITTQTLSNIVASFISTIKDELTLYTNSDNPYYSTITTAAEKKSVILKELDEFIRE